MCRLLPAPGDAPAFMVPSPDSGFVSLTHASFDGHLKSLLEAAGFPSLRVTFEWHCGADPSVIKLLGDWASEDLQAYLDSSFTQHRLEPPKFLLNKMARFIAAPEADLGHTDGSFPTTTTIVHDIFTSKRKWREAFKVRDTSKQRPEDKELFPGSRVFLSQSDLLVLVHKTEWSTKLATALEVVLGRVDLV
ncbi:hypothetical protein Bbelb_406830 [Branchiostoma belcheri]|nr:hypothetical protein Bbelb_406830 [Branchiostoma belcheri]